MRRVLTLALTLGVWADYVLHARVLDGRFIQCARHDSYPGPPARLLTRPGVGLRALRRGVGGCACTPGGGGQCVCEPCVAAVGGRTEAEVHSCIIASVRRSLL